ncbi:hypothetical protein [Halalkalibaculum sp. DA384]|uniref:hypothetical protein n=1 Tax=Halalkalibaculum sp. DA384 TaxID=3373606 RepID=UPI0037542398
MKTVRLKEIINEEVLNEFRLEKDIKQKIDEFGELSEKITYLKDTLNDYKSRYKQLEDELRPLLSELEDLEVQSMKTNKYLVEIKRKGYERENYKYKKVFKESLNESKFADKKDTGIDVGINEISIKDCK